MSRVSLLDQPLEGDARVDELVDMLVVGATREEMATAMGRSIRTISDWRKREDVQKKLTARLRERANRVRALADSELVARLTSEVARRKLSVDQLLKIQAQFPLEAGDNAGDAAGIIRQLMEAAHKNPALAQALQDVLPGGSDGG